MRARSTGFLQKIAEAIASKASNYTLSDIEAEKKKYLRNIILGAIGGTAAGIGASVLTGNPSFSALSPVGVSLASLSGLAIPKNLEDIAEKRRTQKGSTPEVDPETGFYIGPYHKVDILDKEGFRELYKKLLKRDYNPNSASWFKSDVSKMREDIIDAINNGSADLSKIKAGQIASLVYPYAYNVAKKTVDKWKSVPTRGFIFGYKGI